MTTLTMVKSPSLRFSEIRLYVTKEGGVAPEYPLQIHYDEKYPQWDDTLNLMHNFDNNRLDRSAKIRSLVEEIKAFNQGKTDIYPENLRQRLIKIIQAVKPNEHNQVVPSRHTAWDVLSTHRDKLIEYLKNPAYVFKKTHYGLLFCPKDKILSSHGT